MIDPSKMYQLMYYLFLGLLIGYAIKIVCQVLYVAAMALGWP